MLIFPPLSTGALSQFPVRKRRTARTVVNTTEDARSIKLADPAGQTTEWQLQYIGLSDAELATLQEFFTAAEGSLNTFTFLDPSGNLLAWSEDLSESAWQKDSLLTVAGGVADAAGGQKAWLATNSGAGPQGVSQTVNAPAGYTYCFSVYVRATQSTTVTLTLGGQSSVCPVGTNWSRISFAGAGDSTAASISFGIELQGGAAVDLFGPQVEAQAAPSAYQSSTTGGVYETARFRDDVFSYTSTDVNRHSVTLNILYVNNI